MVIFNSYVKLPEGICYFSCLFFQCSVPCCWLNNSKKYWTLASWNSCPPRKGNGYEWVACSYNSIKPPTCEVSVRCGSSCDFRKIHACILSSSKPIHNNSCRFPSYSISTFLARCHLPPKSKMAWPKKMQCPLISYSISIKKVSSKPPSFEACHLSSMRNSVQKLSQQVTLVFLPTPWNRSNSSWNRILFLVRWFKEVKM